LTYSLLVDDQSLIFFMMRQVLLLAVAALLIASVLGKDMEAYYKRTGAKFLSDKAKEAGVHSLPSGMMFKYIQKGDGEKSPTANDDCEVHYAGTLRDGTKFDSSYDRGVPATFKPTQVIKGWTEALQLMREGDIWEVYIPYELGYGARGSPPKIPAFSPLVFKMELLKVKGSGKAAETAIADLEKATGKALADL
jgi:FKBP-type peptidyl-prolyl cis-trans isomerase FklB